MALSVALGGLAILAGSFQTWDIDGSNFYLVSRSVAPFRIAEQHRARRRRD